MNDITSSKFDKKHILGLTRIQSENAKAIQSIRKQLNAVEIPADLYSIGTEFVGGFGWLLRMLTLVNDNLIAPASPEKVSELLVSKEEFLDIEVPEIVFSRYEPQIFNGLNIKFGGRALERLKRVVDQMPSDNIPLSFLSLFEIIFFQIYITLMEF